MWLPPNDSDVHTAVLTRGDGWSAVTVHDRAGEVMASQRFDRVLSPPQAGDDIRGAGYMVSGWEQGEPGVYWARVWLAPVKDFSSMGGWQKESGVPPASMWALPPEVQAELDEMVRVAQDKARAERLAARERPVQLRGDVIYRVKQ